MGPGTNYELPPEGHDSPAPFKAAFSHICFSLNLCAWHSQQHFSNTFLIQELMNLQFISSQMHVLHGRVGTGANVAVKPNNKSKKKKEANFPSLTVTFRRQLSERLFLFRNGQGGLDFCE